MVLTYNSKNKTDNVTFSDFSSEKTLTFDPFVIKEAITGNAQNDYKKIVKLLYNRPREDQQFETLPPMKTL